MHVCMCMCVCKHACMHAQTHMEAGFLSAVISNGRSAYTPSHAADDRNFALILKSRLEASTCPIICVCVCACVGVGVPCV